MKDEEGQLYRVLVRRPRFGNKTVELYVRARSEDEALQGAQKALRRDREASAT